MTIFFAGLVLLLGYNVRALDDPPYWDALLGLFTQSLWLADHDFDYVALLDEPPFWKGGSLFSPYYALAPIYAGMFKLLSPAVMWPLCHVLNLLFAALAIAVFYALLKERLGAGASLLWCLALALDPIWSGQCAAIYLEIPQAAAYLLALRAFDKERYKSAGAWCLAGFLVKPSGLLLALAFAVYVPARYVLAKLFRAGELRAEAPARSVLWLAAPLLPLLALFLTRRNPPFRNPSLALFFNNLVADGPQQLAALIALVLLAALALSSRAARRRLLQRPRDLDLALSLCILIFGFWAAYFVHANPLVRYTTALWAPTLLALALLLPKLLPHRLALVLPLALALFGGVNQQGLLLPRLPSHLRRSGDRLERSREFLDDLEANRRLCRELEAELADTPILAKFPFVRILSRPEFGYVSRPLDVLSLPAAPTVSRSRLAEGAVFDDPRLHVLYVPNSLENGRRPRFNPPAGAVIVKTNFALGGLIVLYRRPND